MHMKKKMNGQMRRTEENKTANLYVRLKIRQYGQAALKGKAGVEDHQSERGSFSIRALN